MGSKNWHLDLAKGKSNNDLDKNGVMVAKKKKAPVKWIQERILEELETASIDFGKALL